MDDLKRFLLLSQKGNMTESADELFITQPALSQSIKRLEQTLHTKLFTRKGRTLEITHEGKALLPLALKIVDLWERAQELTKHSSTKQILSIGMFDNVALRLAPMLQHHFTKPEYSLELTIDNSEKLFLQLQSGILDIALCVLNDSITDASTLTQFKEILLPVSSRTVAEPSQGPFILYNRQSHTRRHMDILFAENNIDANVIVESTSPSFMKALALQGLGIAFLPSNMVAAEIKSGALHVQHFPFRVQRTCGVYHSPKSQIAQNHPFLMELQSTLLDLYP